MESKRICCMLNADIFTWINCIQLVMDFCKIDVESYVHLHKTFPRSLHIWTNFCRKAIFHYKAKNFKKQNILREQILMEGSWKAIGSFYQWFLPDFITFIHKILNGFSSRRRNCKRRGVRSTNEFSSLISLEKNEVVPEILDKQNSQIFSLSMGRKIDFF